MKVCATEHEEIVFDDSGYRAVCPLCAAIKKHEEDVRDLEDAIEDLREEITSKAVPE